LNGLVQIKDNQWSAIAIWDAGQFAAMHLAFLGFSLDKYNPFFMV